MERKIIKISSVKPHPENPNRHPKEQIIELQKSLEQFKQVKNIVTWQGFIIAGHGLVEAAKQKGYKEIEAVDVSEWPEEKAKSFMIADNSLSTMGIIDDDALSCLLSGIIMPGDIPGISESFLEDFFISEDIDFDILEDGEQELKIQSGHTVKMAIFVKDIENIEKALRATGEINRGVALKKICEEYLAKR